MSTTNPTKQANPHAGRGGVLPPKNRQFGQPEGNPRHNGAWHKEDTPRYKMEMMMKMTDAELEAARADETKTSFERSFANILYLSRTATDIEEAQKCMIILEKMVNQVYGQMPTVQITAEADKETEEDANKFIRGFALT